MATNQSDDKLTAEAALEKLLRLLKSILVMARVTILAAAAGLSVGFSILDVDETVRAWVLAISAGAAVAIVVDFLTRTYRQGVRAVEALVQREEQDVLEGASELGRK